MENREEKGKKVRVGELKVLSILEKNADLSGKSGNFSGLDRETLTREPKIVIRGFSCHWNVWTSLDHTRSHSVSEPIFPPFPDKHHPFPWLPSLFHGIGLDSDLSKGNFVSLFSNSSTRSWVCLFSILSDCIVSAPSARSEIAILLLAGKLISLEWRYVESLDQKRDILPEHSDEASKWGKSYVNSLRFQGAGQNQQSLASFSR